MKKITINPKRIPAFILLWLPSVVAVVILYLVKRNIMPALSWWVVTAPMWGSVEVAIIAGTIIVIREFIVGIPQHPPHAKRRK